MPDTDKTYHRVRAQQCREMAALASDPDVRSRHEKLAELHNIQAAGEPQHA